VAKSTSWARPTVLSFEHILVDTRLHLQSTSRSLWTPSWVRMALIGRGSLSRHSHPSYPRVIVNAFQRLTSYPPIGREPLGPPIRALQSHSGEVSLMVGSKWLGLCSVIPEAQPGSLSKAPWRRLDSFQPQRQDGTASKRGALPSSKAGLLARGSVNQLATRQDIESYAPPIPAAQSAVSNTSSHAWGT
jgi:hypothetical protein